MDFLIRMKGRGISKMVDGRKDLKTEKGLKLKSIKVEINEMRQSYFKTFLSLKWSPIQSYLNFETSFIPTAFYVLRVNEGFWF